MKILKYLGLSHKKRYLNVFLLVAILLIFSNSFIELYNTKLIKIAFDYLTLFKSFEKFLKFLILIIGLKIFTLLANFFSTYTLNVYRRRVTLDNQLNSMHNYLSGKYEYLINLSTGDIARRIISDAPAVSGFGPDVIAGLLKNLLILIGGIILLTWYSPILSIISLIFAVFIMYFNYTVGKVVHLKFSKARETASKLTSSILYPIYNILLIKAYSLEQKVIEKLSKVLKNYNSQYIHADTFRMAFNNLSIFLGAIYSFVSLLLAGNLLFKHSITIGTLISILVIIQLLNSAAIGLGSFFLRFNQVKPSFDKLLQLNQIPLENGEDLNSEIKDFSIEFRKVTFKYGARTVLKNLDLKINSGDWVGIVGQSGEGKSTLVKLIIGLFENYEGEIFIGGEELRKINKRKLRELVTYIPQEDYVFDGTIRENLTIVKNATEKELWESLEMAGLKEYVKKVGGLDTNIRNTRLMLSGGEKQRLSIARAFLKGGKIFIFDESMSQLDSLIEQQIYESLEKLAKDKTLIFIAHRISTVAKLPKIFVLYKGKIVDSGKHEELIQRCKIYKTLCQLQLVRS